MLLTKMMVGRYTCPVHASSRKEIRMPVMNAPATYARVLRPSRMVELIFMRSGLGRLSDISSICPRRALR